MLKRKTPLSRSGSLSRRTRLKSVSKKRARDMRTYSKLRKEFLAAHPWCQWFIAESGHKASDVSETGWIRIGRDGLTHSFLKVPFATEIHHKARRGKHYLNVKTWMAVSEEGHRAIESRPGEARKKGYVISDREAALL